MQIFGYCHSASGISNSSDYNNKRTKGNVWRNGGNTSPQSA